MKWLQLIMALLCCSFADGQVADTLPAGLYQFTAHDAIANINGESRPILQSATFDLSRLKIHCSTLLPGKTNHPLVAYADKEEVLIVRSGTLTMHLNNETKDLPTGSVVLMEPGSLQSCSNNTNENASYYVLAFISKDSIQLDRGQQAGGSEMHSWNDLEVKKTDKGFSRPIIRKPTSMFTLFDIHATTLHAGQSSHPPHTHRNEEVILLVDGSGEMYINGTSYKAIAGDLLYVSPLLPHNFTNTGIVDCNYFAIQWTR